MDIKVELDSFQRELLMRMYRSHLNEEVFPVSFDVGGVGDSLMACGFIVAADGFYTFTEYGLEAWWMYRTEALATYSDSNQRKKALAQLQVEVERKKMAEKKLSAWELKARENLSDNQVDVLKMVKSHTGGCPADLVNHHTRKSLERYGYLEYDSENNVVILTADGYEKLASLPARAGTVASMVRAYEEDDLVLDNADSLAQETPIRHSNGEGAQCADDCDECVYREVVALISKKHPEVGELADTMVAQKRLLAQLKLGE